jgi:DNA repair protein RadC
MEIASADQAFRALDELQSSDVEEFWVLALGPTKTLLGRKMIFRGTVDSCLVHPRDVFRFAYLSNASGVIVAHNHPSNDPRPSEQDLIITHQLLRASKFLEIPVHDHLIITRDRYASFAREGWCNFN